MPGCGRAISHGVPFLVFLYFDETACLPVLLVFGGFYHRGRHSKGLQGILASFFSTFLKPAVTSPDAAKNVL